MHFLFLNGCGVGIEQFANADAVVDWIDAIENTPQLVQSCGPQRSNLEQPIAAPSLEKPVHATCGPILASRWTKSDSQYRIFPFARPFGYLWHSSKSARIHKAILNAVARAAIGMRPEGRDDHFMIAEDLPPCPVFPPNRISRVGSPDRGHPWERRLSLCSGLGEAPLSEHSAMRGP